MDEAQTWTAIGLLATVFVAMAGLITATVRAMVNSLKSEMQALRSDLTADGVSIRNDLSSEIRSLAGEMRAGFAAVNGRIDTLSVRVDGIDRRLATVEGDLRQAFILRPAADPGAAPAPTQ